MPDRFLAEGALLPAVFLAVYLVALIGVGAYKARSIKTQEDFSLAGRRLSTKVLVGTLLATWIGTGSIFGNAEKTYSFGLAAVWLLLPAAFGIFALYLLAPRIRRFGQFTIQDILEARFGPAARVLGTITLLLAYVIIVSYQYRAGAAVLGYLMPDLGQPAAVALVAVFVILYTALAGLFSVAYTDVANGLLMALGLALALPILLSQAGGWDTAIAALEPEQRTVFGHSAVHLISILLPPFLLVLGDANMVQRFFAARDARSARRSAIGMLVGVILLDAAILGVALLGRSLVAQGLLEAPANHGHMVVHLAFEALPPLLGALLLGTVVAVVVSTADSYLLSPATSLVRDVVQRFLRPDLSARGSVLLGRGFVVVLGLVALGLAFTSDAFFEVALFAYTIYGAGITPALLAAYFWPRATAGGAVTSMVSGVTVGLAHEATVHAGMRGGLEEIGFGWAVSYGEWAAAHGISAVLVALPVSLVALVAVSLASAPPPESKRAAI